MKFQRFLALFKMDLKKTFREPAALFLIILFPIVLTAAFGAAFGTIGIGESSYDIAIINLDGAGEPWSQALIGNVSANQIFNVKTYSTNSTAHSDLIQGRLDAILLIPENFSESCESYWSEPFNSSLWLNVTVELYVDSGSMIASQAVPPIMQQMLYVTLFGEGTGAIQTPINLGIPSLVAASKTSQFDYMVPGLFAFACIFMVMTVSQSILEEKERGLLRRIYVTPTTSSEFIMSHGASNMVFAILQTGLIFLLATVFGFTPAVGLVSYFMVFLIVMIFALSNVGFGLIIASISKSSGAATGLSFVFILPQMFLGTYVPVPEAVAQFVPSYYVTDAITSLFLRGAPANSPTILIDLLVVISVSGLTFLAGIVLFKRFGKN